MCFLYNLGRQKIDMKQIYLLTTITQIYLQRQNKKNSVDASECIQDYFVVYFNTGNTYFGERTCARYLFPSLILLWNRLFWRSLQMMIQR